MNISAVVNQNEYTRKWMRLAVFNFLVVALAGVALRYKLTFPLPLIDFKNLLHAHSHFAFSGWVSAALFILLIHRFVSPELHGRREYRVLFFLNQLTSFGMLFSFLIQEYGPVSIAFSTANIFVSYGYAYLIWQHTKTQPNVTSLLALRASLVFLIVSSFGPFALAYIVAAHVFNSELLHNAIYWYLHFQYNGWFSFALFALLIKYFENHHSEIALKFRIPLVIMMIACIPTYLLSVIWTAPPIWIYLVGGAFAGLQVVAFLLVTRISVVQALLPSNKTIRLLLILSFLSFAIKIVLQFLSVFPSINQFVFGHRPVIIGYLHLVMLGFVSFYIIASSIRDRLIQLDRIANTGILIFIIGVFLNEIGLMMQGFSGIFYTALRWTPVLLFYASLIMLFGITLLSVGQRLKNSKSSGA